MRKVLVCGGRDFNEREWLFGVLDRAHARDPIGTIIHGAARGADTLGDEWAKLRSVAVEVYPADWKKHGKRAGYLRNKQILDEGKPNVVAAFPGGKGTAMMCSLAKDAGVKVVEFL